MIIQTRAEWDTAYADNTKIYFIVIGDGGRQNEIYGAAERQSFALAAYGALWVKDRILLPRNGEQFIGNEEGIVAFTLNRTKDNAVSRYKDNDLPSAVLDSRVEDAFSNA